MKNFFFVVAEILSCVIAPAAVSAQLQPVPATAPEIFKQFAANVVKIEVVETGSAAKASVGTGFHADPQGRGAGSRRGL